MVPIKSELATFIIDSQDEDCPSSELHLASYVGDLDGVKHLLQDPNMGELIDSRVRPYLTTPLRLAATGKTHMYDYDIN